MTRAGSPSILCIVSIHSTTPPDAPGDAALPSGRVGLPIVLDSGHPAPFYQQIVEQVRRLVLSGRLPPGSPLPSVRALAAQLGTSVITTRRAYEELERAGLIMTRQGTGSFVAALGPEHRLREQEQQARAQLSEAIERALALGLPAERIRHVFEELLEEQAGGRAAAWADAFREMRHTERDEQA